MDAETALTIAGGIVAVVVFGLFFANICGMIDGERPPPFDPDERPPDHPRPTAGDSTPRFSAPL